MTKIKPLVVKGILDDCGSNTQILKYGIMSSQSASITESICNQEHS